MDWQTGLANALDACEEQHTRDIIAPHVSLQGSEYAAVFSKRVQLAKTETPAGAHLHLRETESQTTKKGTPVTSTNTQKHESHQNYSLSEGTL